MTFLQKNHVHFNKGPYQERSSIHTNKSSGNINTNGNSQMVYVARHQHTGGSLQLTQEKLFLFRQVLVTWVDKTKLSLLKLFWRVLHRYYSIYIIFFKHDSDSNK